MELLKQRILKDGIVKDGNVLKVDSFLNHQMDTVLFGEIGKEFKRLFEKENVTKILTIEASGFGLPFWQDSILACQWYSLKRLKPKI